MTGQANTQVLLAEVVKGKKETVHVGALDHLRGLAALFVCLYHFSAETLPKLTNETLKAMWSWGYNGVTIFFVISGFVIPFAMIQSRYEWRQFAQFMGKRIVRICPPSWVIIALTIGQWVIAHKYLHSTVGHMNLLNAKDVFYNMFYLVPLAGLGMDNWFNGVFWTLAVEFQYYILLALAFPLFAHSRTWLIVLCVGSLVPNFWLTPLIQASMGVGEETRFVMANLSLFWLGIVLCLGMCGRLRQSEMWIGFVVLTLVVGFQLAWIKAAFGAATFVFIRYATFRNPVTAHLGKISYSLYLVHIVLGTTLEGVLVRVVYPETVWQQVSMLFLIVLLTIAGATVFYHLVEAPCIQLTKKLFSKRKKSPVHSSPPSVLVS